MKNSADETDLERRLAVLSEECSQLNQTIYEQNRLLHEHHRVLTARGEKQRLSFPLYFGESGKEPDVISFASSGNSEKFVDSGFSESEDGYRWTEGDESTLYFILPPGGARRYQLKIRARAFQTPRLKQQRARLFVNHNPCGELVFNQLAVKGTTFEGSGDIRLSLKFPDAASPASARISDDERDLGLAIYWIAIAPDRGRWSL